MRIPRFYTEQPLFPDHTVVLEEPASHHLLRVLRLRPGAPLVLFNGDGREYTAIYERAEKKRALLVVQSQDKPERESSLRIELGQGVSRGERMDFVLQKSVELGVHSITPLWTTRSQVQLDSDRLNKRICHWRRVITSACEQSGRVYLPQLHNAMSLREWCDRKLNKPLQIALDPEASLHLRDVTPTTCIRVLVGPEGGLDTEELTEAENAGFRRVRLGPRVLRTETAALAALAAMQALWGDLAN
jgi:16S rRNA (uracil1498-N3)-methyltransferase